MTQECKAKNCSNAKYSSDYCKTHYQRINKLPDDENKESAIMEILLNEPKKCLVENCSAPHRRNGYCTNHSQKFKRGTLFLEKVEKLCSTKDCNEKHYSKGFCLRHYKQVQRNELSVKVGLRSTEFDRGNINFEYTATVAWSRAVKRIFKNQCMICTWNSGPCDAHHIIEKSKNGPNTLQNAIVLCPNCHSCAHNGKLTIEFLQDINKKAIEALTISVDPKE